VDEETGRGVPCVRLRTANSVDYWTDSAGMVAFYDPELMSKPVFFSLYSFGYSYPRNWLGERAVVLRAEPGGSAVVKMHRENIAQRLYRITGSGIYHDSLLLGDQVPPTQDPSEFPVVGQDSVLAAVYHGKLFWIWGDTGLAATPLGNFKSTGATSELPSKGGLDPEVGVYLTYFRNQEGRVRAMANMEHDGPIWLGNLRTVPDKAGKEHLLADYAKIRGPLTAVENGLVEFNDATGVFDHVLTHPKDPVIRTGGHPFRDIENGLGYFYYPLTLPALRSRTDLASAKDLGSCEAFTCLKPGSRFDGSAEQLDRDQEGNLRWAWRKNTSPVGELEMGALIRNGHLKPEEQWYRLMDVDTGQTVLTHGGSIYWNPYRQRWLLIFLQSFGASWLGEVWYAEGDTPLGPWVYCQKIVTHAAERDDTYGFYGVVQHPEFDEQGGRVVFFEGTYTMSFSSAKQPTPRYDYNQMMYKLVLDDPRLFLPVPVYRLGGKIPTYHTKNDTPGANRDRTPLFFAPDRPREGTLPVYQSTDPKTKAAVLTTEKPAGRSGSVAFYAISPEASALPAELMGLTAPLNEFVHTITGARVYSPEESLGRDYRKSANPVCRVWKNPIRFNPYKLKSN
jgi:hypothetical protein